jgi:hypothetical protein
LTFLSSQSAMNVVTAGLLSRWVSWVFSFILSKSACRVSCSHCI